MTAFDRARRIGLTLPDVTVATGYDGAPRLQVGSCFMAALASHSSAEPDSLVVRAEPADRELLLEDAPDTYYVSAYYARHPVVLIRLARIGDAALREMLSISRRLTLPKTGRSNRRRT